MSVILGTNAAARGATSNPLPIPPTPALFFEALAARAPVAIYHADPSGQLTYVNARYREMFELAADQSPQNWVESVHPQDRASMQAAWSDFCRRPRAAQFHWRSLKRNGDIRMCTETVVPMNSAATAGFVGIITDVTELHSVQQQVEVLHQQLIDATHSKLPNTADGLGAHELQDALRCGQFVLHYQPKVDIASGNITSAEALLRWHHPANGLIAPAQFIPLAERTRLIVPMGEWVVSEACRQARAWQSEGLPPIRVAVNLSALQFRQGNLLDTVRQALQDAELDARCLEIELTESTVMDDAEGSVRILNQLSQMGVLISVDDFGTGYSSMSYLRRFPVDKLKIDRSFIKEILQHADDAAIVSAIISLAHTLKIKVVAEGVETYEQLQFLKSLDCDQYQGFYCSAALPAADFARLLRRKISERSPFMATDALRTHSKLSAFRR